MRAQDSLEPRSGSGKVEKGLVDPNNDFHLLVEDASGKWTKIDGLRAADNESFDVGKRFPEVSPKAFRLFVTKSNGNFAHVWEWEPYRIAE